MEGVKKRRAPWSIWVGLGVCWALAGCANTWIDSPVGRVQVMLGAMTHEAMGDRSAVQVAVIEHVLAHPASGLSAYYTAALREVADDEPLDLRGIDVAAVVNREAPFSLLSAPEDRPAATARDRVAFLRAYSRWSDEVPDLGASSSGEDYARAAAHLLAPAVAAALKDEGDDMVFILGWGDLRGVSAGWDARDQDEKPGVLSALFSGGEEVSVRNGFRVTLHRDMELVRLYVPRGLVTAPRACNFDVSALSGVWDEGQPAPGAEALTHLVRYIELDEDEIIAYEKDW